MPLLPLLDHYCQGRSNRITAILSCVPSCTLVSATSAQLSLVSVVYAGRAAYAGACVNRADRLCSLCTGGQVSHKTSCLHWHCILCSASGKQNNHVCLYTYVSTFHYLLLSCSLSKGPLLELVACTNKWLLPNGPFAMYRAMRWHLLH